MGYMDNLIEILSKVQVSDTNNNRIMGYEEGISFIADLFAEHKKRQSTVYFIGNGGSAAIACHMTADYLKNGGMRTCSLYNSSVLTCLGNDYGYEYVFSKQIDMLMTEGDLLVAISSSGESPNIIKAIESAHKKNGEVIAFTGFNSDNKARGMCAVDVYVPCDKYGIVESIHNIMLQQIVDVIMEIEDEK